MKVWGLPLGPEATPVVCDSGQVVPPQHVDPLQHVCVWLEQAQSQTAVCHSVVAAFGSEPEPLVCAATQRYRAP